MTWNSVHRDVESQGQARGGGAEGEGRGSGGRGEGEGRVRGGRGEVEGGRVPAAEEQESVSCQAKLNTADLTTLPDTLPDTLTYPLNNTPTDTPKQ